MIAHKTARLPFRILKNAGGSVQTVEDYVSEAIQAAAVTEQAYASLYNAGALADRTDAVYNLMNCAYVYSGCGDNQRALALLEKILSGYVPDNEQERKIYQYVLENGFITSVRTAELLAGKQRRARAVLQNMIEGNYLRKEGAARSTIYVNNTEGR